jgi:hypothetical protein
MLIEKLRPLRPFALFFDVYKKIKLQAKYFIIISAEFIDRRELLQITVFFLFS